MKKAVLVTKNEMPQGIGENEVEVRIEKVTDLMRDDDTYSIPAHEYCAFPWDIEEKAGVSLAEVARAVFEHTEEPCVVWVRRNDGKLAVICRYSNMEDPAYIFNAKPGETIRVTTPNVGRGPLTRYYVDRKIDKAPGEIFDPRYGKTISF